MNSPDKPAPYESGETAVPDLIRRSVDEQAMDEMGDGTDSRRAYGRTPRRERSEWILIGLIAAALAYSLIPQSAFQWTRETFFLSSAELSHRADALEKAATAMEADADKVDFDLIESELPNDDLSQWPQRVQQLRARAAAKRAK